MFEGSGRANRAKTVTKITKEAIVCENDQDEEIQGERAQGGGPCE